MDYTNIFLNQANEANAAHEAHEANEAHKANEAEALDHNEAQEALPSWQIRPLPPSQAYDSYDELYDFIQGFHRDNGAALIKRSSSEKRG
ncbi:hypothetical protein HRG_010910 [Hirsutella rhossiliensis]|uniref:Uncharacterized protein n=1 Tax=Hirsutella rhossiliensis TaxID=111463 RepID=A0A9P8MMQ6_9HYPO|nr:uncharacterized protein HRG_10910 [Hirsutella rhossiliensis]KAH0957817.1 hypothetical protein HRG_10910 [Hirsutella rhossiliensis]